MNAKEIYRKAIKELNHRTFGRFEHDEEKAIELFDKLLDANFKIHCDEVREMCKQAGYDEYASNEISNMYDVIDFYKQYKKGKFIEHWNIEKLIQ